MFRKGGWSKSGCVVQAKGVSWAKDVGGRAGGLVGAVHNSPWGADSPGFGQGRAWRGWVVEGEVGRARKSGEAP